MSAFRLVFNATALLAALLAAWLLGVAALHAQPLPGQALALGRLLREAGAFPAREAILFTAPTLGFDGSSWGWDLLASQAWQAGGAGLLRGLDAAVFAASALSLVAASFRRGARPFSTAFFCAWALVAARPDLHPGPALAAWALFCVALWLLEGPLDLGLLNRWIWLPPLALLALNVHWAALALAPLALLWLAFERDALDARGTKLILLALLLLCLCLHPQGPLAYWGAWRSLAPSPLWPGAFAARQSALLFLALAWLLVLASAWTRAPATSRARDLALLLAFSLLALASRDALPWVLALAAPLAALRFDQLVDALPASLRRLRWPSKAALLALGLAWAWRGVLLRAPLPLPAQQPQQTVAFYDSELLDLRILCPPAWTAGLAQALSPHASFALDQRGRAEPAKAALAQAALAGAEAAPAQLQDLGAEAAWLPLGSPLAVRLATAQGWQPVSVDDASVLYVRELPTLKELIRVNAPRGLRLGDPQRPFDPSREAEAEADLEMRLARDPKLGVLYLFQAELWLERGHEAKARQTLEAGIRADPAYAGNYGRLADLRAQRGETAEARLLYQKALQRQDRDAWRQALAALGHS